MDVYIIAVGKQMPSWVEQAFEEYRKRLSSQITLVLHEITAAKRRKGVDLEKLIREEGDRIIAVIPSHCHVVALERTGKQYSSTKMAAILGEHLANRQNMAFIIGGPEGLDQSTLKQADEIWSLSELTMAHPVVRVVLAEQLYRAWSIIQKHPYHR